MDQMPVSPPTTVYDYLAIKDTYAGRLDECDLEWLAGVYALCSLERYRDDDFCRQVEAWLGSGSDPIRQRFDFGYTLGAHLYGIYFDWANRRLPSDPNVYQFQALPPDDPEYPGELPEWIYTRTVEWLVGGIQAYPNDEDLIDRAHQIKYRYLGGYTFLEEEHILQIEAALGYQVRLDSDPRAQARLQSVIDAFNQATGRTDETPPGQALPDQTA